MNAVPWHELLGFVVLWLFGYVCYLMGRRFEEDKWIQRLVGFAEDLDEKAQQHRDDLERIPR